MALVSNPKDGDNVSIRQAIARLSSSKLGPTSSPTFADITTGGLTLSDLTATRLVSTNASKGLVSTDIDHWVTGTSDQITVTNNTDGTITLSLPQDYDTGAIPRLGGLGIGEAGSDGEIQITSSQNHIVRVDIENTNAGNANRAGFIARSDESQCVLDAYGSAHATAPNEVCLTGISDTHFTIWARQIGDAGDYPTLALKCGTTELTFLADTSVTLTNGCIALDNQNEIRFLELDANGSSYVGFKASAALAGNQIWTLPIADGTAGQVLSTNASGVLSWVSGVPGPPAAHTHDGDTLQLDAINSNGGAFAFNTTGAVTFNQSVTLSNACDLTVAGHIIFNTNNSYIGFANPRLTFNDTDNQIEVTGGLVVDSLAVPGVFTATQEPTGFVDRVATLSWDDGTYTFTITGNHDIYINGVKTSKTTASKQVTDATGLYWIYYNVSGVLTASTTHPGFNLPLIATVYWNTTTNKGLLGDERHGIQMDGATHEMLHYTVGSRYESGLAGVFDATTLAVALGKWHDEDIEFSQDAETTCNVLYHNGDANFEWDAGTTIYYKMNGANLRYNNGNDLADVGANRHIAMWVFTTNDITTPIVALMGQREDVTLANARANNKYESLTLGTLPYQEMKLLYRVILKNTGSPPTWVETEDLRSISNIPAGTYVATAHGVLTGLTNDDHTQYPMLIGRSGGQTIIGSTVTAEDLTLKDNSVDNNTITVTQAIAAYDHIHNLTTDIDHDALTNFSADEHFTQAGIVAVGTIATGVWNGTDIAIADGGTGQSTAQLAINALTAVAGGTNEHVLTKDTDTGNAIWKAATGGGADAFTVKVDAGATAGYLGAASNDGVLRTETGLSYTDGGDYVTLGLSHLGIESLTDPGADKIMFWDDGETASKWLTVTEGVQIATTNLKLNVNGLTAITTIDAAADYVPVYDATDSTHKKILPTNLGHRYVDRGDPTTYDWLETGSKAILNTNGAWHDLDCSTIVPAGAIAIAFRIWLSDDVAGSWFQVRKNGNTNTYCTDAVRTQVANIANDSHLVIPCDSGRVIEYSGSNVAFVTIALTVVGWFI